MNKYTASKKAKGELAIRHLSERAQRGYNETDPLKVYEYTDPETDRKLYAVDMAGERRENLTERALEEFLEALTESEV